MTDNDTSEEVPQGHKVAKLVGYYIERDGTQHGLRAFTMDRGREVPIPLIFDSLEIDEDEDYRNKIEDIVRQILESEGQPGDRIIKKHFTLEREYVIDALPKVEDD